MKQNRWGVFLLFLISVLPLWGQNYMFKHLEVKDGLSNNQVTVILRDSEGFMWFGTASGLNRYDGYEIKVYRNREGDPNTLPDNYISGIQEDREGRLWVRTGSGYSVYHPDTDRFDNDLEGWLWKAGISGSLSRIYIDREKTYWIYVAGKGLYRYRGGEGKRRVDQNRDALDFQKVSRVSEPDEFVLSHVRKTRLDVRNDARGLSSVVRAKEKVDHVPREGLLRGTGFQGIEIAEFPVLPVRACENPFEPAAARRSAEVFARENAARSRKKGAAKE